MAPISQRKVVYLNTSGREAHFYLILFNNNFVTKNCLCTGSASVMDHFPAVIIQEAQLLFIFCVSAHTVVMLERSAGSRESQFNMGL